MSVGSSAPQRADREMFVGRTAFIFAAIGSAVGLGNIWRFPYVAYDNGGGAFMIPYLIALLTAGIPLLFLDYAIGHKYRGSAPLSFRRLHRKTEAIGWWQVLISFVIGVYYAVIVAWAGCYMFFSINQTWGEDPAGFFTNTFTQSVPASEATLGFEFVPGILWPLVAVWAITIIVLALGVQKGISRSAIIFIPLLVVMFVILVIRALFLPGAVDGLNALFTPDWSRLLDSSIWVAAYGQIFFSLSVSFGIMLTYASYLKRKTDLTGSGLVVAFSNSSFEVLAGIGVFAALGFMAFAAGTGVDEVAASGIGLAFIAFPTIISEAPAGALIGILFFGSLLFAGFTSMISIIEVIIAAVQDKLGLRRVAATLAVGIPMALISILLYPTTTGLNVLDVTDVFVNNFGIVGCALVTVVLLTAGFNALPRLRDHLNKTGSFKVGRTWQILVGGISVIVLGYIVIDELTRRATEGYNDMPTWFVGVFGWGMTAALIAVAYLMSKIPWSRRSNLNTIDAEGNAIADPILDPVNDAAEHEDRYGFSGTVDEITARVAANEAARTQNERNQR